MCHRSLPRLACRCCRRWLVLAPLLLVTGCWVGDGRLVVKGTVRGMDEPRPIRGATVIVGEPTANERVAQTLQDGRFQATYGFGGMLGFESVSRNPTVQVTAPGYQTLRFDLEDTSTNPQVHRSDCQPPQEDCFVLYIFLAPGGVSPAK